MAKSYAMHKHPAEFAIAGVDLHIAETEPI